MKLTSQYTVEIEVDLIGDYVRPYAGDSACPPNEAGVEDVDIEYVGVERAMWLQGQRILKRFDLLKGLDAAARAQLIANLIEAIGHNDIEAELLAGRE